MFTQDELGVHQRGGDLMGRVVIEKLTKVKGKKVRKAVIEDAFAILAEC